MLDAQKTTSEKKDDEMLNGEAKGQTELTYDQYKKRGNCNIVLAFYQKVQVGNGAIRRKFQLYKARGGKNLNDTKKTYRKPREQLFSQQAATQSPNLTKNMKTYLRLKQHKNLLQNTKQLEPQQ